MKTCPNCRSGELIKVIGAGMPMKVCSGCNVLLGEPWATIYATILAPIENSLKGYSIFMCYQGSYLKALWHWLRNGPSEE